MHELGVAMDLYRTCRAEVDHRGGGRLVRVKIAVGELAGVEPQLLHFAWPAIVGDGPDQQASLDIEWRPAVQKCESCGPITERQPGSWLRLCPVCGAPLRISDSSELEIVSLEFAPASPVSVT